jgi:hypothetical protein
LPRWLFFSPSLQPDARSDVLHFAWTDSPHLSTAAFPFLVVRFSGSAFWRGVDFHGNANVACRWDAPSKGFTMKRILTCLGAALALGLPVSAANAQYVTAPASYSPYQPTYAPRVAPDCCGPGFYCSNGCTIYGPSYCVTPPFPPVGGLPPQFACQQQQQLPTALPYNPWTRSPRDFFMWNEAQRDRHTRENAPPQLPR